MHGFVSGSRWRCPDPLPFLHGVSAALCVRTSDVRCKRDSMNQCPHPRPFHLRWSPHLSHSLSGLPVFNNAQVATRDAANAAYITEATLKKQTVGARLAANVAEEGTSALDLRGRNHVDGVTTLQMRTVNALFGFARKRLTKVVRLGVPSLRSTTGDDSLALLEQCSSPVRWTLAIESPRHAGLSPRVARLAPVGTQGRCSAAAPTWLSHVQGRRWRSLRILILGVHSNIR